MIWHAREKGSNTYSSVFSADSPSTNYSTPYELMVVEANPNSNLTPWYDAPDPGSNDAYHSGDISEASDTTSPALKFWNTATGRTTDSGLHVHSVGPQGSTMTFVVGSGPLRSDPEIGLTASSFTPSCDIGTNAPSQAFTVFNRGDGTLSYTITKNVSWLSLDAISGTATTEGDSITLEYHTDQLADGTYEGVITVADVDSGRSQTIHVVLVVNASAAIATSTQALDASLLAGMSATDSFRIANSGAGTLNYTLSASASWLTLDRASGTAAAEEDEIQVTYDASRLVEGTYSAAITVSNSNAGGASQVIDVTLHVSGRINVQNSRDSVILWQGNNHNITWLTDGWVTGDVKIELYKGGVLDSIIASSQSNNGLYKWRIPDAQAIGTDYRIRITSVDFPSIGGESLTDFSIAALPALTDIPYSEGFETDFGVWTQSVNDHLDWTRNSGGTPTSSTGPSAAQDGTTYIYTESSSDNSPYKSALLEGVFDLRDASAPMLSFYYHMYGSTMGTLLIRASADQTHWTTLFSRTGDQGNSWQAANADVSAFAGQVVTIQIIGTTGSSYRSDMALDAISISEAPKTLVCDTRIFIEESESDGLISNSITMTLSGDTFTPDVVSGGHVTANNVPSGLTAEFVRNDSTQVTLTMTGHAISHGSKDSISDLQVQFADGAFTGGAASGIAGSTRNLMIDYIEIVPPNSDPSIINLPADVSVRQAAASNLDLSSALFSDPDSGENSITLTLSADNGTLSATGTDHVRVTGSGTGTVILNGTAAAIDTFLNTAENIQYTGAADAFGNDVDTISLTGNDGGNTGPGGGTDVLLGTVSIDVKGTYVLSVANVGVGRGTVTSNPAGIDCGTDCSQDFFVGTSITLTAIAADDYSRFTGWSGGGCFGTGDCIVNLAGDTVVTAVFTASDRDNDGIPDHLDAFPDDQRYNDDGDNDGMPSIWEARYGLNPAIDDAAMDSDGDGLSNINEFIKGTDPLAVTDGPGIAVLEAPDDFATERPLTPTLDVGYASPDFAIYHDQTCWEIAEDAEFTMDVLKITSPTFKTQITVPQGVLDEESTYYWRVHYIDTDGVAWAWSPPDPLQRVLRHTRMRTAMAYRTVRRCP